MEFLYITLGVIFGCLLVYFILKPKLQQREKLDEEIFHRNEYAQRIRQELEEEIQHLNSEKNSLYNECCSVENNINSLNSAKQMLLEHIEDIQKTTDEYAENFYKSKMETMTNAIEQSAISLGQKYQDAENAYKKEYSAVLEDCVMEFQQAIEQNRKELTDLQQQLAEAHKIVNAAVEANRRAEEIKEKDNFYKLNLTQEDLEEIIKLREVVPHLRDASPLNKVIWKCYYEKPYTDLIGRVVGDKTITGIYKITNTENGMCYVGQARDISDRWRQHIKRGLGAEPPTRNKLYPAMATFGVENFTFEVVEECDASQLNAREDAWQDYFHAKTFGYSIK